MEIINKKTIFDALDLFRDVDPLLCNKNYTIFISGKKLNELCLYGEFNPHIGYIIKDGVVYELDKEDFL